ncbi:MAG: hypothetical protein IT355_07415 [Gemmatimonadaceae bacterium]|nr:hypothetical protein [Gemmatimonadaceae bacterium]
MALRSAEWQESDRATGVQTIMETRWPGDTTGAASRISVESIANGFLQRYGAYHGRQDAATLTAA